MKPIFHEITPVNGIPVMTGQQIRDIMSHNSFREEKYQVTPESLTTSLESLQRIYAEHTGIKKKEIPPGLEVGQPCPFCDNEFFRRTGPCLVCVNCGESSSCG